METGSKSSSIKAKLKGCWTYFKKFLKWFGIILLVLLALGVIYQTIATELDKRNFTPRGEFYEVNGHKMHIVCKGEGEATVILQAGGVAESLWWFHIQNELAKDVRVCAFDRPGMGWSEVATTPRDAKNQMEELHQLLQAAGVKPPYVMVGHSLGAILSRIYTSMYPEEVKGLVLVDSALLIPKQFTDEAAFREWKQANDPLQWFVSALTRTGILRLIVQNDFLNFGYPPEIAAELAALRSPNRVVDADYNERIPHMWDLQKAAALGEDFGNLPLVVIWASATSDVVLTEEAKRIYFGAKDEIKTYSENSVERTIQGANHGSIIGNENYAKQVVQAIKDVMASIDSDTELR